MERVMLRLVLLAAVVATMLVPAPARAVPASIAPGDAMSSSVGGCTLGFAATDDEGATYFMTAAHCVESVGEDITLDDGTVFADVAVEGDGGDLPTTEDDWALLTVRPQYAPLVVGTVRGKTARPSGYTTSTQTAFGDVVTFSGHGVPWFIDPITRENRFGVLVTDDPEIYTAIGLDTQGDSGGPILHQPSGKALGLVSRLCLPLCTSEGPTVEGILAKAAALGYDLTLKTG